jgi:FdhD protein
MSYHDNPVPTTEPVSVAQSHRLPEQTIQDHTLAEETPVAIVFDGTSVAVMMATPSDIRDFAYGFALTEGYISCKSDVCDFEIVQHKLGIEARFWLVTSQTLTLAKRRRSLIGSMGCGLCGIESLDQAVRTLPVIETCTKMISQEIVIAAPDMLRAGQHLHDQTHAAHAAGFLTEDGGMICVREDVGRHNALDKLIGHLACSDIETKEGAIVVTSRLSVELVQKCAMAHFPVLISVSAPTAHAVRMAQQANITAIALGRRGKCEVFSHPERIRMKRTGSDDGAP